MNLTDAPSGETHCLHSIFHSVHHVLSNSQTVERFKVVTQMLPQTLENHAKAGHELLLPPIRPFRKYRSLENFHQQGGTIVANQKVSTKATELETRKPISIGPFAWPQSILAKKSAWSFR
ncbi:MAG: hypothetical protein M2R45_01861 [Verrucomicrobia subdivision 3 bacterium]|nr:hypothetical protein [Limisphaerales bacterium]MCS1415661.1 hypothetical protein [Limisphaerales bacterium]